MSARPSVVKTVLATLAGEMVGRASLLGLNFYVANRLGAENYGRLGILVAIASMLQPLADLGLTHLALRNLSRAQGAEGFPLLLGLKLAGTAGFALLLTGWMLLDRSVSGAGFLLAGSVVLLTTWGDFFRQVLRARGEAVRESWMRVMFVAGALAGMLVMAWGRPSPELALLCLSLPPLALCTGYASALVRGNLALRPSLERLDGFLRTDGRTAAGSIAYLVLVASIMRLDVWMANHFLGTKETGVWLSAYNMTYAGAFLAQGLASIAMPRLMDRSNQAGKTLFKVWRLQASLAVSLFVGVTLVGPWVFPMLFRGKDFSAAAGLLPLLGAMLAVSTLMVLAYHLFLVTERLWWFLGMLSGAVVFKAILGWLLVPRLGLAGMAWAGLLSEGPNLAVASVLGTKLYLTWRRRTMV